jgi:hypothetical protein
MGAERDGVGCWWYSGDLGADADADADAEEFAGRRAGFRGDGGVCCDDTAVMVSCAALDYLPPLGDRLAWAHDLSSTCSTKTSQGEARRGEATVAATMNAAMRRADVTRLRRSSVGVV